MNGSELAKTPWPDQDVNLFRDYGNLTAFETDQTVDVNFVANGTVFDLSFEYVDNRTIFGETFGVASVNGSSTNESDTNESLASVDIRLYRAEAPDDSGVWEASKWVGRGFAAHGTYNLNMVDVFKVSPDFDLRDSETEPEDLVSISCGQQTTDSDGGGGLIDGDTAGECSVGIGGGDLPLSSDANEAERRFFYSGELGWCHTRGRENWAADVGRLYNQSETAFKETLVKPIYGGASCWFVIDGNSPSHDTEYYHLHSDPTDQSHPYPYDTVSSDHECETYMQYVDNAFNHINYHNANNDVEQWPLPDNYQVLHGPACTQISSGDKQGGLADYPGPMSIATDHAWAPQVSPHEFGHNYAADHGKADCLEEDPDGQLRSFDPLLNPDQTANFTTLMGEPNPKPPDCVTEDTRRTTTPQFSAENIQEIDDYVS